MKLCLFLCTLWLSASASAVVTAVITPVAARASSNATVTPVSTGVYDVSMSTTYNASPVTFTVSGATTDSVRSMTMNANNAQIVFVYVHGPTNTQNLQSLETFSSNGSTGTVIMSLLRITQNVHSIRVNSVLTAVIGGNMTSFIECLPRDGGGSAYIQTMSVGGSILGDIKVEHGFIDQLTVTGAIGASNSPVDITVNEYVNNITAAAIYADIAEPSGAGSGFDARRIATTAGPFVGSLRIAGWQNAGGSGTPGLHLAGGNLDADIIVLEDWGSIASATVPSSYNFVAGRVMYIAGDLDGDLTFPSGGLDGQVIINAADNGGTWTGDVTVGATTLSPTPDYDELSSTLGGGAVGLVEFGLHKTDCLPPHSPTGMCDITFPLREWPDESERETIILRHYGPVFDSLGNDPKPVIVYLRSRDLCLPTPCPGEYGVLTSWADKTTYFDVHVPGDGSREVWVSRVLDGNDDPQEFNVDYHTKIDLVLHDSVTQLRSDATLAATAPQVGGYPYILETWCEMLMGPRPLEEE